MMIYKAPQQVSKTEGKKIFLGGTIEMGVSINWQEAVVQFFRDKTCTIFNPRRDDWGDDWKQEAGNSQFSQQVNWELDAMEMADIIILNFLPGSQSPITLLEFGLYAQSNKLMVCCPKDYWRSGNVHIVCDRYGVFLYDNIQVLLENINL